jgi:hypothetical protein
MPKAWHRTFPVRRLTEGTDQRTEEQFTSGGRIDGDVLVDPVPALALNPVHVQGREPVRRARCAG